MPKLLILTVILLLTSCTFKKVENHYHIWSGVSVITQKGEQVISGSDAKDALNGNTPSINLKGY